MPWVVKGRPPSAAQSSACGRNAVDLVLPIPAACAGRDGVKERVEFCSRGDELNAVAELLDGVMPEEVDGAEAGAHARPEAERFQTRALGDGIVCGDSDVVDRRAASRRERTNQARGAQFMGLLQFDRD